MTGSGKSLNILNIYSEESCKAVIRDKNTLARKEERRLPSRATHTLSESRKVPKIHSGWCTCVRSRRLKEFMPGFGLDKITSANKFLGYHESAAWHWNLGAQIVYQLSRITFTLDFISHVSHTRMTQFTVDVRISSNYRHWTDVSCKACVFIEKGNDWYDISSSDIPWIVINHSILESFLLPSAIRRFHQLSSNFRWILTHGVDKCCSIPFPLMLKQFI